MINLQADSKRRAFWLKQMYQWHWISSALCLAGMLVFAVTGITLNHAGEIHSAPKIVRRESTLPGPLLAELRAATGDGKRPLPRTVSGWLEGNLEVRTAGREAEWSAGEAYVALPMPGGDSWVSVQTENGKVQYERTERGWIAYLNDLHKGRNTGLVWSWFLDLFAGSCVIFCVTGFVLLYMHAANRVTTWPVVALGVAMPVLLILLFIH